MQKFTFSLKKYIYICFCLVLCVFTVVSKTEDSTTFVQNSLVKHYNNSLEKGEIKRFEINVTNTGFCRYKKFYNNGKTEYFALNLAHFKDLDYYGTVLQGNLYLRTLKDDVIVQTHNDKNGDIDSMATYMVIPLKDIDVTELNQLTTVFKKLNLELLGKK